MSQIKELYCNVTSLKWCTLGNILEMASSLTLIQTFSAKLKETIMLTSFVLQICAHIHDGVHNLQPLC